MPNFASLNQFAQVKTGLHYNRSMFPINWSYKTTFKAGSLIPLGFQAVLPGDSWKTQGRFVLRNLTPVVPVMDNAFIDVFAFYVPKRIIAPLNGDDWKAISGENTESKWSPAVEKTVTLRSISEVVANHSVANYLGLPIGFDASESKINPYPLIGFAMIYDEWFRNENVEDPIFSTITPDNIVDSLLAPMFTGNVFSAYKLPDMFTSCLPAPQKGDSVTISLGDTAPLTIGDTYNSLSGMTWNSGQVGTLAGFTGTSSQSATLNTVQSQEDLIYGSAAYPNNLYADLSQASAVTINALRNAFAIQRLLERDARAGTRYREILYAHYGVTIGDGRVQVPEYLGGFQTPINITQVLQTSSTDSESALGFTGAFSNTFSQNYLVNKSFPEEGYLYYVAVVRTKQTYSQGVEKEWTRYRRFDSYNPAFANIGEQPIYKDEIYCKGSLDPTDPNRAVFGYNEAWVQYRTKQSMCTGSFSPDSGDVTFNAWTYAQKLTSAPSLVSSYLKQTSDVVDKTLVADTSDQYLLDFYFTQDVARILPVHSVPGLLDHN